MQFPRVFVDEVEACVEAHRDDGFVDTHHFIEWSTLSVGFPVVQFKPRHPGHPSGGWREPTGRARRAVDPGQKPDITSMQFDVGFLDEVETCVQARRNLGFQNKRQFLEFSVFGGFQVVRHVPRPDFRALQASVPARGKWRLPRRINEP